ncbi:MAG: phosphate/phosphite/phosphonate ABC transporter substrate-binding protein [Thiobacillus sp.]
MNLASSRRLCMLSLAAVSCLPALSYGAKYQIGIFGGSASREYQSDLKKMYKPLAEYIAKESGSQVRVEISQSFKNMENHLDSGRYAILLAPPHITAAAIDEGYEPVAKWNKPLLGMYVVAAGKPYKRLADLKGTRVGVPSREIAIGGLCVNALNKAGIRADKDLGYVYEGKYQDVMASLLASNQLDAICTGPAPWKAMSEKEPGKYRILDKTAPIPGFALSIDTHLSKQEKETLTRILVGIGKSPAGKKALEAIKGSAGGATDTLATNGNEYFAAKRLLEETKRDYNAQIPE